MQSRSFPATAVALALAMAVSVPAFAAGKAVPGQAYLNALRHGTATLTVGTDATFPPFEYTTPSGAYIGFDISLVTAIANVENIKHLKWIDIPFSGLIPALQSGHFNMVASAVYITPQRSKAVAFSHEYFPGGLTILVAKNNTTIHNLATLAGKTVAVQTGTKSVDWLKTHQPKAIENVVETNDEMFNSLLEGRVDAVVTGYPAARYFMQQHKGLVKTVGKELTSERYGFVFLKSNTALREAFNHGLAIVRKNGTYEKLVAKWFGS